MLGFLLFIKSRLRTMYTAPVNILDTQDFSHVITPLFFSTPYLFREARSQGDKCSELMGIVCYSPLN